MQRLAKRLIRQQKRGALQAPLFFIFALDKVCPVPKMLAISFQVGTALSWVPFVRPKTFATF